MRWVRANVQFGAGCALFALAMQFALAFGHVHFPGTGKGLPSLLVQLLTPASAATTDVAAKPAKPAKPAIPKSQTAHEQCAVCTSIQLAGGLIPGAAPSFQLPTDSRSTSPTVNIDPALAASPHNSFQARAPPQA